MKIILDNIGFSLQRMGGLSVVWGALLNALKKSDLPYVCLDYQWGLNNEVRQSLSEINVMMQHSKHLQIERYINPVIEENEPFIFHSSHYRVCNNKHAINITTVHDFTYERYRKGLALWIHSWQKYRAIRKADIVVCVSENTKKDLLNYLPYVDERKIRIIYNGVSNEYNVIETGQYSALREYVLFVGSRQAYKQFDLVVNALKDTKYKLAIVGGKLNKKEERFVDNALGKDNYIQLGYLSNLELNEVYNQVFCLAYPSAYEGFGIPILEAQKSGCPVIAYNSSSIPEVIGRTPLLLNELTISEFRSKLEILKDKANREIIIADGLKNAKRFSWDKMGNEYVELYKEIIYKTDNRE